MRALTLYLTTESPLAIRADHSTTGAGTIDYIPGSSFVGGLAALYRDLYSQGSDFTRFFLTAEVLFSDLYPANFEVLDGQPHAPVYPLPRTAISCKRHAGFYFDTREAKDNHGVEDNLRNWAMLGLSKYKEKSPVLSALREHKHCNTCKESMDHFAGYYRRRKIEREQAQTDGRHLQTRTGINRKTGTVEDGILYNRLVFKEGVHFWGQIMLVDDDELYNDFFAFLEKIGPERMLHLGTGRTRGLGRIRLDAKQLGDEQHEEKRFQDFQKRLTMFNELIKRLAGENALADKSVDDYFFALTLHSSAILRDELLRYQGQIDDKVLNKLLGEDKKLPELYLLYQNAGTKRVTGWNELWGTPKTNEYAIEAGSVFLFRCLGEPNPEQLKALFQLEEQGIGSRRAEGFGRICISDAFHSEERQ